MQWSLSERKLENKKINIQYFFSIRTSYKKLEMKTFFIRRFFLCHKKISFMKIISVRQNAKESGYPDETCTKNVQYSARYIHLYEKRTEKEKFCLFFWRKIGK